jgi:hypothetical protein
VSVPAPARARVVIALHQGENQAFVLDLARQIASTAAPELLGLFIENVRLLALAKSRLAREVMLSGGERPLEAAALERQLRTVAARARAEFEGAAARLGMPHEFQIARGDVAAELLNRSAEAEALIVSLADEAERIGHGLAAAVHELCRARLPLLLLARPGWLGGHRIAVVVEEESAREGALEAAARIAGQSRSPVVALLAGGAARAPGRQTERISDVLARRGVKAVDIVTLGTLSAAGLVRAVRLWQAQLLVMPAVEAEAPLVDELVRSLTSSLLLVRP